ncbi:MAG: SDR family oxidoreductase [Burkholderiales bacterium]|nr:SDR family oxidoreductase [Burkholderiales bacterium]
MAHEIRKRRVLITGASSGIGAALARSYAARGATLGLVARREAELRQLAAQLDCDCAVYALDVRDGAALRQAAADFMSRHGCPDVVIANAGVSLGTLTEYPEDVQAFQDVIDINVVGMVKTFQPFVTPMREAGRGALVGIASVAGYRGLPGAAAYSASKAAAISYLESLRVEFKRSGVKVVTICPGYIATPMTEKNPYPMPFIMSADTAARKITSIIERGGTYAVIPWQMALVARVLRVLPNRLYDRLLARAPHKPRKI